MGHPAEKYGTATYADLEALPEHEVGEILNGELYAQPRPRPQHARVASDLGSLLGGPFRFGNGGPGGWWIISEPELHFPNPAARAGKDVVVPDVAGWRIERMPRVPEGAHFTLAPDWVCEVLSKGTEKKDREVKLPIYEREGVRVAWLLDLRKSALEVYTLGRGRWGKPVVHQGAVRVRVPPFETMDLDLSIFWAK